MATTTHLGITLIEQSQSQKELTANAAFTRLDALLNTGAKSRTTNTPPGSPASGDLYIVGSSPTGAWSGQANMLAYYDQVWKFITPNEGMTLWVNDEDVIYSYNGSAWIATPNGYIFPYPVTFSLPGSRAVGSDLTGWIILPNAGKFVKATITAKTAPSGAALICDILKSSNHGVSWTSLWASTPANRIQMASGSNNGSQTSFDTAAFAAGDLLRIDIAQVGSTTAGSDVTVLLQALMQNS